MSDTSSTGYPGGYPGYPGGGSYGPGYGVTLVERLHGYIGKSVTVFVEEGNPIRGMLQAVGSNFVEVQRVVNGVPETVIIPIYSIKAITPA